VHKHTRTHTHRHHRNPYTMGTRSFQQVQGPWHGVFRSPSSIVEIPERAELYLYSKPVPSQQVMWWTFPFYYRDIIYYDNCQQSLPDWLLKFIHLWHVPINMFVKMQCMSVSLIETLPASSSNMMSKTLILTETDW